MTSVMVSDEVPGITGNLVSIDDVDGLRLIALWAHVRAHRSLSRVQAIAKATQCRRRHRFAQSECHGGRVFRRSEATVRERDASARGKECSALPAKREASAQRPIGSTRRRPGGRWVGAANRCARYHRRRGKLSRSLPENLLQSSHSKNWAAVLQNKPVTN